MSARIFRGILYTIACAAGGILCFVGAHTFFAANPALMPTAPAFRILSPFLMVVVGVLLGVLLGGRLADQAGRFAELSKPDLVLGFVGAVLGMLVVAIVLMPISNLDAVKKVSYFPLLYAVSILVGTFVGFEVVLAVKGELSDLFSPRAIEPNELTEAQRMRGGKILDTNVIIDGRVLDISRAGFLQGSVYIPGFVLDELQYIADSADSLKRQRGRRGLEILSQMRKDAPILARELDDLAVADAPVDVRLVSLAKSLEADIVTNDYNLNKVAELQGVKVLNINQLANALKPVVMPGEEMRVAVLKEGKEAHQGIGYLDDGTMVVVENGRRFLGDTIDVVVTSMLQNVQGKMIFGIPRADYDREEEALGRNVRNYSGGGPRRKARPQ